MSVTLNELARRVANLEQANRHKKMALALQCVEKFVSSGKRTIRGIASTASVDRMGDIVVPSGGTWKLPTPLLWQHRHDTPIGWVRELRVEGDGIRVVAELAEGIDAADKAWQMVEAELVSSFSIGFIGIKGKPISTGTKWESWDLLELSVVTIPANSDARITATKSQAKAGGAISLRAPGRGAVQLTGR